MIGEREREVVERALQLVVVEVFEVQRRRQYDGSVGQSVGAVEHVARVQLKEPAKEFFRALYDREVEHLRAEEHEVVLELDDDVAVRVVVLTHEPRVALDFAKGAGGSEEVGFEIFA